MDRSCLTRLNSSGSSRVAILFELRPRATAPNLKLFFISLRYSCWRPRTLCHQPQVRTTSPSFSNAKSQVLLLRCVHLRDIAFLQPLVIMPARLQRRMHGQGFIRDHRSRKGWQTTLARNADGRSIVAITPRALLGADGQMDRPQQLRAKIHGVCSQEPARALHRNLCLDSSQS